MAPFSSYCGTYACLRTIIMPKMDVICIFMPDKEKKLNLFALLRKIVRICDIASVNTWPFIFRGGGVTTLFILATFTHIRSIFLPKMDVE